MHHETNHPPLPAESPATGPADGPVAARGHTPAALAGILLQVAIILIALTISFRNVRRLRRSFQIPAGGARGAAP